MPITQIPSNIVVPKQPKVYVYENNTAATGTWYTALSATNIRGILSKITLSFDYNVATANRFLEIRVTIDGTINTIGNPTSNVGGLGLTHGSSTTAFTAHQSFDYFCNTTFTNSITVEFRQITTIGPYILIGNIMYSTE